MSCFFRVACIAMRSIILPCFVFTLHYCYSCFLHYFTLFCFPLVGSAQHCMSIACNSDFDVCFTYWSEEQAKSVSHALQAHPCFSVQARGGALCRVCVYGAPGNSLTVFPEASDLSWVWVHGKYAVTTRRDDHHQLRLWVGLKTFPFFSRPPREQYCAMFWSAPNHWISPRKPLIHFYRKAMIERPSGCKLYDLHNIFV